MESRRFRGEDLSGLVAVGPTLSGVPFWVWCWTGGVAAEAGPAVLVTRGPNLDGGGAARVSVYPEVGAVLDGPLIEADDGFDLLAAWLAANGPAICGYWYQVGPVRAADILALLRPAPGPSR
jgi:hypothetical protein